MGSVNEPHVDTSVHPTTTSSYQEHDRVQGIQHDFATNGSSFVSTEAIAKSEVETPESELSLQPHNSHDSERITSRVLIRESESSDLWIPLSSTDDSGLASSDKATEPEPANASFPLSDSEIPETFDTCVDLSALSNHPIHPQAPKTSDSYHCVSPSLASASPKRTESVDLKSLCEYFSSLDPKYSEKKSELSNPSTQPECADLSQPANSSPNGISYPTGSQEGSLIDLGPYSPSEKIFTAIPRSETGDSSREMAIVGSNTMEALTEQFSRPESVSRSVPSPLPPENLSMEHAPPSRPTPGDEDCSFNPERHIPGYVEKSAPLNVAEQGSLPSAGTVAEVKAIPSVFTYADAANLAMEYPELASHFLTCPLPATSQPVDKVPASPFEAIPMDTKFTAAQNAMSPLVKPHSKEAPNWALAPDADEVENHQPLLRFEHLQRDYPSKARGRGELPSRQLERNRDIDLRPINTVPCLRSRGRRADQGKANKGSGRPDVLPYHVPSVLDPLSNNVSPPINSYPHAPTAQLESLKPQALNGPIGPAIAHESTEEWDLLNSDPWAEHLNSANPRTLLSKFYEDAIHHPEPHTMPQDRRNFQQTADGTELFRKQQLAAISMAARRYLGNQAMLDAADSGQGTLTRRPTSPFRDTHSRTSNVDVTDSNLQTPKELPADLRRVPAFSSSASDIAFSASRDFHVPPPSCDIENEWWSLGQQGADDWLPPVPIRVPVRPNAVQTQLPRYSTASDMSFTSQTTSPVPGRYSMTKDVPANWFKGQGSLELTPSTNNTVLLTGEMTPPSGARPSRNVSSYQHSVPLPSQFDAYQDACGRPHQRRQSARHTQPHHSTHHHEERETKCFRRADDGGVGYW